MGKFPNDEFADVRKSLFNEVKSDFFNEAKSDFFNEAKSDFLKEEHVEDAVDHWQDFVDHDSERLEPEKFEGNPFADWLMNPERKNESAALMLAKHFVKDDGKQSVAEMRELLDFAENALRERIAKIAYKKGLMEIELEEKLTDQGIDAENIEAICAIYDRMLADQMEREVMA